MIRTARVAGLSSQSRAPARDGSPPSPARHGERRTRPAALSSCASPLVANLRRNCYALSRCRGTRCQYVALGTDATISRDGLRQKERATPVGKTTLTAAEISCDSDLIRLAKMISTWRRRQTISGARGPRTGIN